MTNAGAAVWRKFRYELGSLKAMARLRLSSQALLERLSCSMPGLSIEPTNICNANCSFCAYQYQSRDKGVMSMDLFRKVVDEFTECSSGPLGLTPTVGEPLTDPHLLERIRYAREKPGITSIGTYTNMISLRKVGAQALVDSGIDTVLVSTSGLDDEMYRRVYRSGNNQRVVANIKEFARANNAAGRPVNFLVDLRIDRPFAEVACKQPFKDVAELVGAENIFVKYRYDDWSGRIKQSDLSGNMKVRRPHRLRRPRISPCSEFFSGPMVYWDGRVGACGCRDVDASELIIGDANSEHLAQIWLGEELKTLRREFLTPRVRDICKNCTHYNNVSHLLRPDHARELATATTPCRAPTAPEPAPQTAAAATGPVLRETARTS